MKSEKLERYCDVISGYAFKSTDWRDSGVPVVKIGNISNGTDIIFDEQIQYVEEEFKNKIDSKYLICKGDILLSLTGSHINQPNSMVGRCCRNRQNKLYFLNQRAGKVIPFSSVDKSYLYYLLSTKEIKYAIANKAYGGANQVNISPRDVKNIRWTFPRLEIQQRIASILSAYDDLIENNNKRIKILEQMAENLYKEWFVRFRFPGREQTEFENGIPKGWERNSISEFYRTSSGGTPSRAHEDYYADGIHPWVKTGELKDSIILDTEEYITQEAIQKTAARLHSNRSVAMAMYGVNIGMLGYFDSQMACNQACCVFVDRRNFSSRHYLFYCLKSMRDYLMLISFGAAQQNLSQDLIKKVKIIMPPDDLVKSFEEHVENSYKNIRCLLHTNKNLTKQRDMLLPRLMSGKLEV
ncbi:MAG: restriction endonuclease subunit S [Akkermansia sp.]|nr:restriction endonuclease subunit S [Akkermansia sp.]